jgi:hypothetical protein
LVGAPRFELGTPSPPDWCANRAALRSDPPNIIVIGVARRNRRRRKHQSIGITLLWWCRTQAATRRQAPPGLRSGSRYSACQIRNQVVADLLCRILCSANSLLHYMRPFMAPFWEVLPHARCPWQGYALARSSGRVWAACGDDGVCRRRNRTRQLFIGGSRSTASRWRHALGNMPRPKDSTTQIGSGQGRKR